MPITARAPVMAERIEMTMPTRSLIWSEEPSGELDSDENFQGYMIKSMPENPIEIPSMSHLEIGSLIIYRAKAGIMSEFAK